MKHHTFVKDKNNYMLQTKFIHNQQPKDNRCLGGFVLKKNLMSWYKKKLTISKTFL